MRIEALLLSYQKRGVTLSLNGEKLRFTAPQNTLTQEDLAILKERKAELMEYLQAHRQSKLITDSENRYAQFPLTDIQSSYLVGQEHFYQYGGTNCKIYTEFTFKELNLERVQWAWEQVIRHNDMLHAVIEKEGTQRVLQTYQVPQVSFCDLSKKTEEAATQELEQMRNRLTQKQYPAGTWPQFDLALTKHRGHYLLHLSLDMLVADFVSVNLILDAFEQFYYGNGQPNLTELTFRDIVIYRENLKNSAQGKAKYEADKAYWQKKLETMPGPPKLPVKEKAEESGVLFRQYNFFLEAEQYQKLCQQARKDRLTPSNLILTAYAETLRSISKNKTFCIDVTMSDRPDIHPDIGKVVGDFTVVNILEIEQAHNRTYSEQARAIQARLWEDLSHQSFSGTQVLRELGKKQKSEITVPAVYTSTLGALSETPNRRGKVSYTISQTPQVLIDCQVLEDGGGLRVNWDVRTGALLDGAAEEAFAAFYETVSRFTKEGALEETIVPQLSKSVQTLRRKTNATQKAIAAQPLHQGFLKHFKATPESPALHVRGVTYSYGELGKYVQAICQALQEKGFQAGDIAAISATKGVWQIAAVLAVLTLGGAYLPLDAHQPLERTDKIVRNAGAKYCLVERRESVSEGKAQKIQLTELKKPEDRPWELPAAEIDLNAPAYVIFTSGSTGEPKGVVISHAAASNTIQDINQRYGVTQTDRLLNLANLSFDLSVYDLFGAFYAGAELIQATEEQIKDPRHWLDLLKEQKVSIWNSVPAQMKMLTMQLSGAPERIESLRVILLSGDWIAVDLPQEMHRYFPQAKLISLGGATEAAIWSIYYPMDPQSAYERSIPYGKPLSNQQFYILNEQLEELPNWMTGDLYIGGKGLALGYLGDETLTQEKFITWPKSGRRLYKTGDLGRYRPDGNIEFQGRRDFQVKIRGHRVELGEIESAAQQGLNLKAVKVIAVQEKDAVHLCLFGVSQAGAAPPSRQEFEEKLSRKLPKYMIPSGYEYLEKIPLTSNGKVDEKALRARGETLLKEKQKQRPAAQKLSEAEQRIHRVWCELFGVERIGVDEDFFDYGGDSIQIVKLITKLEQQYGYRLSLTDVYAGPTIAQMAQSVEN